MLINYELFFILKSENVQENIQPPPKEEKLLS